MAVFPFGEGLTEKRVFDVLHKSLFSDRKFREFVPVGGKDQFIRKIRETVESEILPGRDTRILVFGDLDHNESPANVAQSFRDLAGSLLAKWNLRPGIHPLDNYSNIYLCDQPVSDTHPGLRLVLHLADNNGLQLPVKLRNQTTEGYVLAAGLQNDVLDRFASDSKVGSNAQALHGLITNSIPQAITQASIAFDEGKDFLSAYLCATRFWVVHRTVDNALLTRIILARARGCVQGSVEQIFATWITAIQEVSR